MNRAVLAAASVGLIVGCASSVMETHRSPSDIELRVDGKFLSFTYDLTGLFDAKLWEVLTSNENNEVIVHVKLVDAKGKTRVIQYHRLELTVKGNRNLILATSPTQRRQFTSRNDMVQALRRIPGQPISRSDFQGTSGYLEIQALVNPVNIYSFPGDDVPVANRKLVPRTVFDRSLKLRSFPVSTGAR